MTKLLFIDGADGVGKTKLIAKLVETLTSKYALPVKTFASLGGSELSIRIRELVMANGHLHKESHMAFVYFMMASMQDVFYGGVIPALKAGNYVIVDRGWISTLVYNIAPFNHLQEALVETAYRQLFEFVEDLIWDLFIATDRKIFNYVNILPKKQDIPNILNRLSNRKKGNNHFDSNTESKYLEIAENYILANELMRDTQSSHEFCRYEIKTISHEMTTEQLVEDILRDVFKLV